MTKDDFKRKIDDAGDAVITYKSKNSRRSKYKMCTRDFTTPYIANKRNRARKLTIQSYYFVGILTHIAY